MHDVEGTEKKDFSEYLESNMRIWDYNIKMGNKESSFVLHLILPYNKRQSGIFGKFNGFILHKNNK